MQYVLVPWDDHHAVRDLQQYSAASEAVRERLRVGARRRERWWGPVPFFAVLGRLPASVHEEMESEYGLTADRLTLVSVAPLILAGSFCPIWILAKLFSVAFGVSLGLSIPASVLVVGCGVLL